MRNAKNFSIHLLPGGRFRMAPLYDVMSAQPNVDAGQIRQNKMKLAMALGTKRHYVIDSIAPRHFVQAATSSGVPATAVQAIFEELQQATLGALGKAAASLPLDFPETMLDSIVEGMRRRLRLVELAAAQ